MAEAGTPVDGPLARPGRPGMLLSSITPVIDGSDLETPETLGAQYDADLPTTAARDRQVRWASGYSFWPEDCKGGHVVDRCGNTDPVDSDAQSTAVGFSATDSSVIPIQPFIVEVTEVCSTIGAASLALIGGRLKRKLLAMQSHQVAKEFWTGTLAQSSSWTSNQYLTNATGLTLIQGGGVVGYVSALAELEQYGYGASDWERLVIHTTPRVAEQWVSQNLVHAVPNPGNVLMTELGTIVVTDSGYPGTGPGGVTAGASNHVQWAYVTGIPQIRLGAIYGLNEDGLATVDTYGTSTSNTRTARAWRAASVAIDPCIRGAVLIDLSTAIKIVGS